MTISRKNPESMHVTISDKDEYYQVILEGLTKYLQLPFLKDLNRTVVKFPVPDLPNAVNKNQVASKKWLVDELYKCVGAQLGTVFVLGGWYGFLSAMLLHDKRFTIEKVISFDLNPSCATVAYSLNHTHAEMQRFYAVTADICTLDYERAVIPETNEATSSDPTFIASPDIVINTSCEHLLDYEQWFHRVPHGITRVLQSNNDYTCPDHVNCVPDVAAFKRQSPMTQISFEGTLKHKNYDRFMLIGQT